MPLRSLAMFALTLIPSVAMAGDGAQVPEGSHATLFALGILGVIIGRRLSMKGSSED